MCARGGGLPRRRSTIPRRARKVTTLDNGLVVVTLEDTSTPVVSFQMWVKVGSRDEAGYTGLAHLFEHMMFNGSKNIGPEQHSDLISARGGTVNAYTSNDETVYFDDATRETLPLIIDLEHERLAHLDISATSLDRERRWCWRSGGSAARTPDGARLRGAVRAAVAGASRIARP
jgi:predicted Zn-dependent peptidase